MDPARIAELLEPFLGSASDQKLTPDDLQHISTYIDILQRWNTRINLTAIRSEQEIVTRHFGESFFAARHLFPLCASVPPVVKTEGDTDEGEVTSLDPTNNHNPDAPHERALNRGRAALQGPRQAPEEEKGASAPAVADVGSGAGFPGIPLKLWTPQIHLTLIESNHKKSTFLREVARALTLTDINIQTTRAETLTETLNGKFDVVTLRAVERFDQILPTAAALLAPAARLALLIGASQVPQAHAALSSMDWSAPITIPQSQSRVLLTGTRSI